MSVTKGIMYILNMTTLERLSFQFIPMELGYSHEADLATVKIVGRNEPKYQFTGGGTTLPLVLTFYAEEINRQDVMMKIKWLETLSMSNGYRDPQPKTKIVWGDMFRTEQWYLKSIRPKFSLFQPGFGMLPAAAEVSLDFVQCPDDNPDWDSVRWPYDFRGINDIVNTNQNNTIA